MQRRSTAMPYAWLSAQLLKHYAKQFESAGWWTNAAAPSVAGMRASSADSCR